MAFEWELDYRLIYTDGTPHRPTDDDSWMGDSRGHWEGDTLVVDVGNINDKTWFDMAGDFHSDALHVVERYHMTDHDTIQYEATIEDSKVFTKPWTINIALRRRTDRDRLFEYVCEAELEEANGAFTREERTWYPGSGTAPPVQMDTAIAKPAAAPPGSQSRTCGGLRTESRTCKASMNPNRRARTRDWKDVAAQARPEAGAVAVSSSIRRTANFRCSPGRWRKRSAGTSPNAGMTIRRPTVSLPACRDPCGSRKG